MPVLLTDIGRWHIYRSYPMKIRQTGTLRFDDPLLRLVLQKTDWNSFVLVLSHNSEDAFVKTLPRVRDRGFLPVAIPVSIAFTLVVCRRVLNRLCGGAGLRLQN